MRFVVTHVSGETGWVVCPNESQYVRGNEAEFSTEGEAIEHARNLNERGPVKVYRHDPANWGTMKDFRLA